jgi:Ca2+-binding EF-hand superfamily protein
MQLMTSHAKRRFDNSTNEGKVPMTRMIDMLTKYGEKEKRLSRDEAIDLINQVSSDKQGDQFDYLQFLSVYFK